MNTSPRSAPVEKLIIGRRDRSRSSLCVRQRRIPRSEIMLTRRTEPIARRVGDTENEK
jgi:hypothetical protein